MRQLTFETDADFIRKKFLTLDKSTEEIATETGLSKSSLGRYLGTNRRVRNVTARKLYNYFGDGAVKVIPVGANAVSTT